MIIEHIQWNASTIEHIARHGVDEHEVEDVCFRGDSFIFKSRLRRYIALGQTRSGRYLTVVFQYLGNRQAIVITARAMSQAERQLYQRR